ncbi:hypothetical protein F4824DRAFT_333264 [Ustulina deusta]|nr:hypothetical protein F4824DRAFT_333264 [Ustulina deusta]
MKFSLATSFFAASAHAAFLSTTDSATTISSASTPITTTSSSSYSSTPTPTSFAMHCGGSMGGLCDNFCFCATQQMNCHADPSARCYQMCSCVAESPQKRGRGAHAMLNR